MHSLWLIEKPNRRNTLPIGPITATLIRDIGSAGVSGHSRNVPAPCDKEPLKDNEL